MSSVNPPTNNTTGIGNKHTLKQSSPISWFESIFRYVGFRKVCHYPHTKATKILNEQKTKYTSSLVPPQPLDAHKIHHNNNENYTVKALSLIKTYTGFRAHNKNLISLTNYLEENNYKRNNNESNIAFRQRIQTAMVLSGIAKYDKTDGVMAIHQHLANGAITHKQLIALDSYLNLPIKDLLLASAKLQPWNHRNTEMLGKLMSTSEFYQYLAVALKEGEPSSLEEASAYARLFQAYLTAGDGAQLLKDSDFKEMATLDKLLPTFPKSTLLPETDLQAIQAIQNVKKAKASPTSDDELKRLGQKFKFHFTAGTKSTTFDPNDKIHCFLFFLNSFRYFHIALNNSVIGKTGQLMLENNSDERHLDKMMQEKAVRGKAVEQMDRIAYTLTHQIMVKKMSHLFGPQGKHEHSYQHTVLEDQGIIYWNSDDFQPRGGMMHNTPLEISDSSN